MLYSFQEQKTECISKLWPQNSKHKKKQNIKYLSWCIHNINPLGMSSRIWAHLQHQVEFHPPWVPKQVSVHAGWSRSEGCQGKGEATNKNTWYNYSIRLDLSPRISGTQNGGTEPYKAILGMGFPSHKPYIHTAYIGEYLHFRSLIFLVNSTGFYKLTMFFRYGGFTSVYSL